MQSAKCPADDWCVDGAGLQQRSNSGGRKLSNQPSADEPDYGVPDFYADDQACLDGSYDLEVERCDLLMVAAYRQPRLPSEPALLGQRHDLQPALQRCITVWHAANKVQL